MPRRRLGDFADLVAGIYAAAAEPSQWEAVLTRIATHFGAHSFALAPTSWGLQEFLPTCVASETRDIYLRLMEVYPTDVQLSVQRALESGATDGNERVRRELFSDREFGRIACVSDIFRPYELGNFTVLLLKGYGSPIRAYTHFTMTRGNHQAELDATERHELSALHPYFSSAAEIHQRLTAERDLTRAALESLDRLPTGMLLIGANGAVLHANAAAEQMLRCNDGIALRQGRLGCADPRVDSRLHGLIAEAVHAFGLDLPASGGAMLLPRPSGLPPWQAIVSPLAPGNPYSSGPAHAAALVMVSDPSATMHVPQARLAALFGFTPAESRVALALANGLSPAEIAERQQTSLLTVRAHIRRLHEKLGVRSQGQLLRRLLQATALRATSDSD